ncbi:keratin-like protein KRT222 [Megalops cyprinoides]|uniref:keratin-like protein KRT222 n=1 Tax=Megalops cyprinoides TaxID=118141 RepID=UPI001864E75D|nr:keratin-like protein KRT222 [Megalops cyprinoides]
MLPSSGLPGLDPQVTLRGLNARLVNFLEQVNRLQEANTQLERQIAERVHRNTLQPRDWTLQERTVEELRTEVSRLLMENAQMALQTDKIQSETAHLQARCEAEKRQRQLLEREVVQLRGVRSRAEHQAVQLEAELQRSTEELEQIRQEHQQAVQALQHAAGQGDVVLMPVTEGEDGREMELSQLLEQIRTLYDGLITNSHPGPGPPEGALNQEAAAQAQANQDVEALHAARAELTEARKQWHSLQVEIESLHALERGLESSLQYTQRQYESQLQDMSREIRGLEAELCQVRSGLENQRQRHHELLNTKVRLEHEIATYRQLLEREEGRICGHNGPVLDIKLGPPDMKLKEQLVTNHCGDPVLPKPLTELRTAENDLTKSPPPLRRQKSLVILTEPESSMDGKMATVKTQEILQGNVVRESAEAHGTVETKKIDVVIKQWEGSFFKGNPKLRKKSVSLRFDLHMAAADEGCSQTQQDSLPDVEVRLVMKRSRSISTITQ